VAPFLWAAEQLRIQVRQTHDNFGARVAQPTSTRKPGGPPRCPPANHTGGIFYRPVDPLDTIAFSAPGGGPAPSGPARIEVPSSARELIKVVASKLKAPAPQRMTEELTGPIIRVERHTDTDTGIVTVQAVRAGRVAHVNVNVSSGRLDEALVWMRARDGRRRKPRPPDKRRADGGQPRRVTPLQTRHLTSPS
jgi:hypothetical protein